MNEPNHKKRTMTKRASYGIKETLEKLLLKIYGVTTVNFKQKSYERGRSGEVKINTNGLFDKNSYKLTKHNNFDALFDITFNVSECIFTGNNRDENTDFNRDTAIRNAVSYFTSLRMNVSKPMKAISFALTGMEISHAQSLSLRYFVPSTDHGTVTMTRLIIVCMKKYCLHTAAAMALTSKMLNFCWSTAIPVTRLRRCSWIRTCSMKLSET